LYSIANIHLEYNEVTGGFPEELALMRTLKNLTISFNDINSFPESIVGLVEVSE
jgi:Leucine-rich repeat (LRR) protein